ncbi:MAG TPA: hypothetical protein VFX96_01505, partial [Pyrinomonadaceae bacterium]|nr:hypothetical protein [Pyrinomonadaceae bacterium]
MSEEQTQSLNGGDSFEARVLAEFAQLNNRMASFETRMTSLETRMTSLEGRLTALEEKVEARLHDTRPIWEAVMSRLKIIDKKLDIFAKDMMELRA